MPGLIAKLKQALVALRVIDGVGYRVEHTHGGQVLHLAEQPQQSSSGSWVPDSGFKCYFITATAADDVMEVGRYRSATVPAVLYIGTVGKIIEASEEVALWGGAGVKCLVLKASESGGTITHSYEWKAPADLAALNADADIHYHPLAWVTVQEIGGYDRVTQIRRQQIAWIPNLAAGSGGGSIPVKVTAVVSDQKYTVSVYANGAYTDAGAAVAATETGQVLYILNTLVDSLDVDTWLMASKYGTHYEAESLGPVHVCGA